MAIHSANQEGTKIEAERLKAGKRLQFGVDTSSVDASAISVETPVTALSSAGVATRTLADGYPGQIKFLFAMTIGGTITVTPAHLYNGTTIAFDAVNDGWLGIFYAGEWHTLLGSAAASAVA